MHSHTAQPSHFQMPSLTPLAFCTLLPTWRPLPARLTPRLAIDPVSALILASPGHPFATQHDRLKRGHLSDKPTGSQCGYKNLFIFSNFRLRLIRLSRHSPRSHETIRMRPEVADRKLATAAQTR